MPIQLLAYELLSKIFVDGVAIDRQAPMSDRWIFTEIAGFGPETHSALRRIDAKRQQPLNDFATRASHVCGPWRHIAKTTTALWTRIEYSVGQDPEKVRQWLNRSGHDDIDIDINDVSTRPWTLEFQIECMNNVMMLLSSHVHRWRSFMLHVSQRPLMELALQSYLYPAAGAPHLRGLALSYTSQLQTESPFEPEATATCDRLFGGDTPVLKNVCLCGVHINWASEPVLSDLGYLRLANHDVDGQLPWEVFSQILKNNPHIRSFEISNSGPTESHTWPNDRIILPRLENLSLTLMDPEYCQSMLDRMDLPSLRQLELDFDDGNPGILLTRRLTAPNRNILVNLTTLKIINIEVSLQELAVMYRNLPNLVELHLNLDYLSHTFLHAMYKLDPIPLPQLRALAVVGSTYWIEALQETISERKRKGYPIKKLMVAVQDTLRRSVEIWFRAEVEQFERYDVVPSPRDRLEHLLD